MNYNETIIHFTDDKDLKVMKNAEKILRDNYKFTDEDGVEYKNSYSIDLIVAMIEELTERINDLELELEEQKNEYEEEIENNYRPINQSELEDLYGMSDNCFH